MQVNHGSVSINGSSYTLIVIETPFKISDSILFILALIILIIIRLGHIFIIVIRHSRSFTTVLWSIKLSICFEYHYKYVQRSYTNKSNRKCKRWKNPFLSLSWHVLLKQLLLKLSFLLILFWFRLILFLIKL